MNEPLDLVVIGGNAGGLSAAVEVRRRGLERVRVLEPGTSVAFPELPGRHGLDVGYGETVRSIDVDGDDLVVKSDRGSYRARAVVVAERGPQPDWTPPVPAYSGDRILIDRVPERPSGADVLVVGRTDHAVELTAALTEAGSSVVLAAGGMDPTRLSPVAEELLNTLERERQATLLYRSIPTQVVEVEGYPMAYFDDRRTPGSVSTICNSTKFGGVTVSGAPFHRVTMTISLPLSHCAASALVLTRSRGLCRGNVASAPRIAPNTVWVHN